MSHEYQFQHTENPSDINKYADLDQSTGGFK
jgi:hypothetical protein